MSRDTIRKPQKDQIVKLTQLLCLATLMLAGCAPDVGANDPEQSHSDVVIPSHNYKIEEGDHYGYVTPLTQGDEESGKLHLFRYLGKNNGLYTVEYIKEDGAPQFTLSCTDPCKFLNLDVRGEVSREEYHASTIGGMVIDDAIAGKLEVARAQK